MSSWMIMTLVSLGVIEAALVWLLLERSKSTSACADDCA